MTEYDKENLEKALMEMFDKFRELDESKIFYSKGSIREALEEYSYETIADAYESMMEQHSDEVSESAELMFEFSNRVVELKVDDTLEEMEKEGYGSYGMDKEGEVVFVFSDKARKKHLDK